MPSFVWKKLVTQPVAIPTKSAMAMAAQTFQPAAIRMAQTAPLVAKEPSTVRSESSRIL